MPWLILILSLFSLSVLVQAAPEYGAELDQIVVELDRYEQQSFENFSTFGQLERTRTRLQEILQRTLELRDATQAESRRIEELLGVLGPVPEEGAEEAPQVATLRRELEKQRDPYLGEAKKAGLSAARAEQMITDLAQLITQRQAQQLLYRSRAISNPEVWRQGLNYMTELPSLRAELGIALVVTLGTFLGLRLLALKDWRYWHSQRSWQRWVDGPAAAGIRFLVALLLPLLVVFGLSLVLGHWLSLLDSEYSLLWVTNSALAAGLFISDSAKAPLQPLRNVARWLPTLGLVLGLSVLIGLDRPSLIDNLDFYQIAQFLLRTMIALLVLQIARRSWPELSARRSVTADPSQRFARQRDSLRHIVSRAMLVAAAGFVVINPMLLAIGYVGLADWLFFGAAGSAALLLGAWLIHRAMLAVSALLAHKLLRPLFIIYLRRHYTRRLGRQLQIVLIVLVDIALLAGLTVGLPLLWQVDISGFTLWTYRLFFGVEFGALTLSLFDILAAVAVLIVTLLLTRLVQRLLNQQVFPHTQLNEGARRSLSTGLGYIGFLLAVLLALITLGVQLTQLALILGGLAVGIGFGLQHIVNNIVSGIILLVERPVRPGDWITLKEYEGLVDRISLRATEIRTFQHASILIPNAEFISNTVMNWTLRDVSGRVDVKLTVERDADDDTMTEILMLAAQEHPKVLDDPPPEVFLRTFTNLGLEYEVWAYTRNIHQTFWISSELRKAILKRLQASGIKLASEASNT